MEKYTTEVVLRQFRGELTSLSAANDGQQGDRGGQQQGNGGASRTGYRAGLTQGERRQATQGGQQGWDAPQGGGLGGGDLNDVIPFGACWQ